LPPTGIGPPQAKYEKIQAHRPKPIKHLQFREYFIELLLWLQRPI
jgi:hypothetical protein